MTPEEWKAWRKDRKAKGLCVSCNNLAIKDLTRCETHTKQAKLRRKRYKVKGQCLDCKKPVLKGYSQCEVHNKKAYDNVKKYQRDHALKGLCKSCSEPKSLSNKYYCEKHFKLARDANRKRLQRIKKRKARLKTRIQEKIVQKQCYECSEPALEGRIRCALHLKRNDEAVRKYQENQLAKGLCRCCPKPASATNKHFCEYHAEEFNHARYLKRGSRGIRKVLQKKIITERTVRIFKSEPILSKNWSQEVEDFIRNNAELFKDPYDKAMFQHADLNDNLDEDSKEEENF